MSIQDHISDTALLKEAIYKFWKDKGDNEEGRGHLGASEIGEECERKLWLSFRRCDKKEFDGRLYRLFDRGKREEATVIQELEGMGCHVFGTQDSFRATWGHFGGSTDGCVLGIPTAERTPHILEIKTHSKKSFADLEKKGVQEAQPKHWAQMQIYMKFSGYSRALYYAVCKDDDNIYLERLKEDKPAQQALMAKAERIVFAEQPSQRIAGSPAFYKCKMCPASEICWHHEFPERNCRNCCYSTPLRDGTWTCDKGKSLHTCDEHIFIPPIISDSYEMRGDCVWHEINQKIWVDCPETSFPEITDDNEINIIGHVKEL